NTYTIPMYSLTNVPTINQWISNSILPSTTTDRKSTTGLNMYYNSANNENRVDNLRWYLRSCSSSPVTLVHEQSLEDELGSIKLGWEKANPGRGKKAKLLREKYIHEEIKENEELLKSIDEKNIDIYNIDNYKSKFI